MKSFRILGIALFVVFGLGVVVASPAMAAEELCVPAIGKGIYMLNVEGKCLEPLVGDPTWSWELIVHLLGEWLVNGSPITAELAVDSEGEFLLEETILGIKIDALCSGIFDGTVGPNGEDLVNELLSLAGVAISLTGLSGTALECTNVSNCTTPLVWAVHLPWNTLLQLLELGNGETFFVDRITSSGSGNPGWEVECMGTGTSDECLAQEIIVKDTNEGSNVDGLFEEAFAELAGLELAGCVTGGKTGIIEGLSTTLLTGGGTLAVSSE